MGVENSKKMQNAYIKNEGNAYIEKEGNFNIIKVLRKFGAIFCKNLRNLK